MLSFVVQVAGYLGLLLVPVGSAWMVNRRRSRLWYGLTLVLGGIVAFVITAAAMSMNQLTMGVMIGVGAILLLRAGFRRSRTDSERIGRRVNPIAFCLVCVPLILVAFRATVLPRAADWSRDRAIRHSAALIAEIESFRQRRGHYPASLHALHPDLPTGVIGIERFHYEPSGDAYNLFFIRHHLMLDAEEAVVFNPRDEHHFTAHALDILQYDGAQLDLHRGDRQRTQLAHPHWISILLD
jgi:hypothetical protein